VGLSLTQAGVISGSPNATETAAPFTVKVVDPQGNTGSQPYTLTIYPVLAITPTSLPAGTVGTPYSQTLTATGGSGGPYTFSVASGTALSAVGFSLSSGGAISGTPSGPETGAAFTVQVVDSQGNTATQNYTLTVNASTSTPAVVTDNETITVTDAETFPDVADIEAITVNDGVTVTPLINVTAPVAFFSTSSLGFGSVAAGQVGAQTITVSNIGEGPTGLLLSGAVISPSGTPFTLGPIACSNGASGFPTTLPSGGACLVTISYTAPASGTPPSATITFADNAGLSNLMSTVSGSSFTQAISLNGAGTTTSAPPGYFQDPSLFYGDCFAQPIGY
jgi:hypothetical protein